MELQTFDLLWLPDPTDTCVNDGTRLRIQEVDLHLEGPMDLIYTVPMAQCPECGQWYGLIPPLRHVIAEWDWEMTDIDGFRMEDTPLSAGVFVEEASLPWEAFRQHMASVEVSQQQPTPSVDEVRALDQRPTTWEVGQAPATWIGEDEYDADLGFVAIVHDANLVRAHDIAEGAPMEAAQVATLVRRAAGTPFPSSQPGRPRIVRVNDADLADALRPRMDEIGIAVEVDATPLVDEALDEMASLFLGDGSESVFVDVDEDILRSFIDTSTRFYEAEPWTRLEGDRFVGVQVDDAPWFFANVMGQRGEHPGLSVFDTWLSACRFMHNERPTASHRDINDGSETEGDVTPFEAAGVLEEVALDPRAMLHPADAYRFDKLGIAPPIDGAYPVPRRFDAFEGPVAPEVSLDTYRAIMEALLLALERRTATPVTSIKTTLDIDGTTVSLRYPSDGTERPYDGPPAFRLVVDGHNRDIQDPSRLPAGTQLVIDASTQTLYKDVAKALTSFQDRFYQASLTEGGIGLWDDRMSRRYPSPRIADLVGSGPLHLLVGGAMFPVEVERPLDTAPNDVRIEERAR